MVHSSGAVFSYKQRAIDDTPVDIFRLLLRCGRKEACHSFSCKWVSAYMPRSSIARNHVLVVVDSTFRFVGGGDRDPSLVLELRFKSLGAAITDEYSTDT